MDKLDRRLALGLIGGAAAAAVLPRSATAGPGDYIAWRDPGCGCCTQWAKRVETAFGKPLPVIDSPDMAAVKRARGVPAALQSCHTALIGGYVIEGHVPPADIKHLIASRNGKVKGLAVAGMPAGSPGMDMGHNNKQPFDVIAFGSDGGQSVFSSHNKG
ncbi:MAG TPA: DUF411 domain-containing protein [Allosphingosinicella sp.]|jgi:hypothetical protein